MKAFEEKFGPPPVLETAACDDIFTTTRGAYYATSQYIWKEALKWVKSQGDRLTDSKGDYYDICAEILDEELGE